MDNAKDFNKPLGQWIEEDTVVKGLDFDPKTKTVSVQDKIVKTKTMYIHAPKDKLRCKDGEHVFAVVDKHKYIFQCKNCRFSRKVYPTTYRFDEATGALTHKYTDARV